ncbi:MAG: tRNA 5-methoxyuridine(34)/uridine 5-oxyacetic acid(34) synthase CmoB [Gammaproteobacteria bacterium]|nr:MAG: tRNA 5-methoxyuridine(34)/uridine 5-oxyacetic acid(34) synthase CmoB [Gammaproteobacteria bacterium]
MISLNAIYDNLFHFLATNSRLRSWSDQLKTLIRGKLIQAPHGDLDHWLTALNQLPEKPGTRVELNCPTIEIGRPSDLSSTEQAQLETGLRGLMPWRKGPFNFFGTYIDTEWRSDWKWQRLIPHIQPLDTHLVLDVGCGSGYHCWRMLGAGAERVIGIDPSQLFLMQFLAVKKYLGNQATADLLPLRMEEMMPNLSAFDSVFSMGVLYHRRSPIDHLYELKGALKPGGQLILETLVIEDQPDIPPGHILMPADRYAMMRNVWFIPTPATLTQWLHRVGFRSVRCVDLNTTGLDEQRTTDWMQHRSLNDFLAPGDTSKTIEGYPAPLRAVLVAKKPSA